MVCFYNAHIALFLMIVLVLCGVYGNKSRYYQNDQNTVHVFQLTYNNLKFKESYVKPNDDDGSGIALRQLSNGRQVLTLIYNGVPFYYEHVHNASVYAKLILKECKVDKAIASVNDFENNFNNVFYKKSNSHEDSHEKFLKEFLGKSRRNVTWENAPFLNFKTVKHECFNFHKKLRKAVHKKNNYDKKESNLISRNRRGLEEVLILPGTKWCGNRRLARSYQDLDGRFSTDSCCRDHDLCPLSIPLLTKKYRLYNRSFTTISHCACDKRFRTCLKQAATGASDIVGKVFFNIVKSHCFVFQRKRTCLKYGLRKCFKWGYRKQAVMKENNPY